MKQPRPRRSWRLTGFPVLADVATSGGRLFLIGREPARLIALDVATGRVLWRTGLTGLNIDPSSAGMANGRLMVGGERIIVAIGGKLAAFDAADGGRLWQHAEPCAMADATGTHVAVRCMGESGSLAIVDLRDGHTAGKVPLAWSDEVGLGSSFVVIKRVDGAVRRMNIGGSSGFEVHRPALADDDAEVVAGDGVVVIAGRETEALSAETGALLWREPDTGDDRGHPLARPVVADGTVYVLRRGELVGRGLRTGEVVARWPLPGYLAEAAARLDVRLVASNRRPALVWRSGFPLKGLVVTWNGAGAPAVALEHPMIIAHAVALAGNTLVLANTFDGVVGGYDLTINDPPLATLPPEVALATTRAEMAGEERLLCDRLGQLPQLGETWLAIAADRNHPLWTCALITLAAAPHPAAGPVLRGLLQQAGDNVSRRLPIRALAHDDEPATSELLAGITREPEPREIRDTWLWRERVADARRQLWRTGRTTTLGLCPAGPARSVPELTARAGDGAIGTPHPILFQDVAADGSWTLVCQARHDTDGRAGIDVLIGHHGDLLGDDVSPYLVVGSGPGLRVEETVAFDPAGRYAAVREGACLTLLDLRAGTALTLPHADLRDDGHLGPHRAATFDVAGRRLLYLRTQDARSRIVVRELTSGRQTEIDVGEDLIMSARFASTSQTLELQVLSPGTFPQLATTLAPRTCRAAAASYTIFGPDLKGRLKNRLVPAPFTDTASTAPPPATVEKTADWGTFTRGIYATRRTDGAQLRLQRPGSNTRGDSLPAGPLRWTSSPAR